MRSKLVLCGVAGLAMVLSAITVAQAQSSTAVKRVAAHTKLAKKSVARQRRRPPPHAMPQRSCTRRSIPATSRRRHRPARSSR